MISLSHQLVYFKISYAFKFLYNLDCNDKEVMISYIQIKQLGEINDDNNGTYFIIKNSHPP